jgi:hypothetical protein
MFYFQIYDYSLRYVPAVCTLFLFVVRVLSFYRFANATRWVCFVWGLATLWVPHSFYIFGWVLIAFLVAQLFFKIFLNLPVKRDETFVKLWYYWLKTSLILGTILYLSAYYFLCSSVKKSLSWLIEIFYIFFSSFLFILFSDLLKNLSFFNEILPNAFSTQLRY